MSTVLGVSCILSVIATAGIVLLGSEALLTTQEVQNAADLAALSGALAGVSGDGEPCVVAKDFAQANGAVVSSCANDAETLTVVVEKFGRSATATAGPTDAAPG